MKTPRFLSTSIGALLVVVPLEIRAENKTITANAGGTVWGTVASWTAAGVPILTDNVVIGGTGAINIAGSAFPSPVTTTDVQDLMFSGTGAITLRNDSASTNMSLTLNGRGQFTPLIATGNSQTYTIAGSGLSARTLSLLLAQSGEFEVANGGTLFISSNITQDATARYVHKTGRGTLVLAGANTFTGGLYLGGGKVTLSGSLAAGSLVDMVTGTTFEITAPTALNAFNVTANGGTFILGSVGRLAGTTSVVTLNSGALGRIESTTGSVFTTHVNAGSTARVTGTTAVGSFMNVNSGGILTGSGTVNGTTTVAAGGTVQPGFNGGGNLTVSNLTFAAGATAIRSSIGTSVAATPKLNATTLTVNGAANSVTITIPTITYTGAYPATFPLVDYSGSILGGSGFSAFVLGQTPNRVLNPRLENNVGNGSVDFVMDGFAFPIWSGLGNGAWTTDVQTTKNWNLSSGGTTDFLLQDAVTFSDAATGGTSVSINGNDVEPSSVIFTNASKAYTISGANGITGATGITKSGAARVAFNTTANSFTGPVTINAGTVAAQSVDDIGETSSLGSGTDIIINGAATTLEYTGTGADSTNRPVTITGGATIQTTSASGEITLSGGISGTGTLTKTGPGTLILSAENVYGNTTISAGTLQVGDTDSYGTLGTGPVLNNGQLIFDLPAEVTVTQSIGGLGGLIKRGTAALTIANAGSTYAGATVIDDGTIIAATTAGNAIPGSLQINAGAGFRLEAVNQIHDTLGIVTIDGGIFGDPSNTATVAITDTFPRINLNSGYFTTGRTLTGINLTDRFQITGGTALMHRGGVMTSARVDVTSPGTIDLDGGSGTANNESKLTVGSGGLNLTNATISFNTGSAAGAVTTSSVGSILLLSGPLTATGVNNFLKEGVAGPKANLDLGGGNRTLSVTNAGDILRLGTPTAPITVVNGGITKTGAGTLILEGPQTYGQNTTINGGRLQISGAITTNATTVANGATLAGTGSTSGSVTVASSAIIEAGVEGVGSLTFGSLTFNSVTATPANLYLTRNSTPAIINVTGNLNATGGAGSVVLNLSGDAPVVGTYTLIDYGTITAGIDAAFIKGVLPNRVFGNIVNNTTAGITAIQINITQSDSDVWTGGAGGDWNQAIQSNPKNWVLSSNPGATIDFSNGDVVVFRDVVNATNDENVEIDSGNVKPAAVRFENNTDTFFFTGNDGIADIDGGTTSLIKTGTGTVSLFSDNSFSGSSVIKAGKVVVNALGDVGQSGGLGTGATVFLGDTTTNATLEIDSASDLSNRAITINGSGATGGGTIQSDGFATIDGKISGSGRLTKTGTGVLELGGANSAYAPDININGGTLRFFSTNALGTNNKVVRLNGGTLEYASGALLEFSNATTPRSIVVGSAGGGISIPTGATGDTGGLRFVQGNAISGTGVLSKYGDSTLRLTAANTGFTGGWSINEGAVEAGVLNALGPTTVALPNAVTINPTGTLVAKNVSIPNPIVLAGGTLATRETDTVFLGNISVTSDSFVRMNSFVATGTQLGVTLNGVISGNAMLSTIAASNTAASGKTLRIANSGNTFSGIFSVTPNQILLAQATSGSLKTLGTAGVQLQGGTLRIRDNSAGVVGILEYGNNVVVNPLFDGVGDPLTSTSVIDVGSGAATSGINIRLGGLTVNGHDNASSVTTRVDFLRSNNYKISFENPSTLNGRITLNPSYDSLDFNGTVAGTGIVAHATGGGVLRLTNPLNSFSGEWALSSSGILRSEATSTGNALGSGLVRLTGATLSLRDNGVVGNGNDQTLTYGNNVIVSGTSTIEVSRSSGATTGHAIKLSSLAMASNATLSTTTTSAYKLAFDGTTTLSGNATFTPAAELQLNGAISGSSFGITKTGTGRLEINNDANIFGNLALNTGTLGGVGLIPGNLTAGAATIVSPGNSTLSDTTGILSVGGNVTFNANTTSFAVELGRGSGLQPLPGEYDQLKMTGAASTLALGNAVLDITAPGGLHDQDIFFLIIKDGVAASTTFNNRPAGTFMEDGYTFTISYNANFDPLTGTGTMSGGNDIAIMIPEPTGVALMLGGLATLLCRRRRNA